MLVIIAELRIFFSYILDRKLNRFGEIKEDIGSLTGLTLQPNNLTTGI